MAEGEVSSTDTSDRNPESPTNATKEGILQILCTAGATGTGTGTGIAIATGIVTAS